MQLGMTIPARGPLANAEAIVAIAKRAEELGFTMMAIPDHIVIPKKWEHVYPYETGGFTTVFDTGDHLEPLALMAVVLGMTQTAHIMPSVIVVPYRPAVLTARQLATMDVASGGRVIVGCGTGWMREEFEAVDAPPFAERGRVTDEFINVYRELWTNEEPSFGGGLRQLLQHLFPPASCATTAPADLDRRRQPAGDAPRGSARRWLVPRRVRRPRR